jgi:hypothetical protein
MISPEQRMVQLRQMIVLRPLLVRHGLFSQTQRSEMIEYLDYLRLGGENRNDIIQINNEDTTALEIIINYANEYVVNPVNRDIRSNEYVDALHKWSDLSVWFTLNNACIGLIIKHFA